MKRREFLLVDITNDGNVRVELFEVQAIGPHTIKSIDEVSTITSALKVIKTYLKEKGK